MADTKISALPASTTPLSGTEVVPVVQSGTTKKVSVANLTAGRAVDASSLVLTNANPRADWVGTSYTYMWQVVDSDNRFRIYDNTNSAERVTVDSTGKFGIANATPRSLFDVTGTTAVTWTSGANNVKGLVTVGTQGTSGGSLVVNTASLNSNFGSAFAVDGTYSNPGGVGTSVVRVQALGVASPGGYDSALAFHTALGTTATEKWRIDSGGNFIQQVAAKGVNFTANTPAAGMTSQLLNWYEEGTFTATATGMTTSPTVTVTYVRVGNNVTLNIPYIYGTSNDTSFTLTGMPTPLKPSAQRTVLCRAGDNSGANIVSCCDVNTSGVINIYKNANGDAFTASGTKGFQSSMSYVL